MMPKKPAVQVAYPSVYLLWATRCDEFCIPAVVLKLQEPWLDKEFKTWPLVLQNKALNSSFIVTCTFPGPKLML